MSVLYHRPSLPHGLQENATHLPAELCSPNSPNAKRTAGGAFWPWRTSISWRTSSGRRHSDPGHSGGDLRHEEKTWPYFRHQISWNLATKEGFMMIYVYIDYIWIIYGFDIWLCMEYGLDIWYIIWNNYGKSQFFMGKSTISMAIFNCLFVCLPGRVKSKVGRPAGQSASFQPFEDGVFI